MNLEHRDKLVKRIGLAQKVFSRKQWREAEKAHANGDAESAAQALVSLGFVSEEQARALGRAVAYRVGRDEDKELARVILDSGYAVESAVEAALEKQKKLYNSSGKLVRLAELLMEEDVLSESQHLAARKILDIARSSRRPDTRPDEGSDL